MRKASVICMVIVLSFVFFSSSLAEGLSMENKGKWGVSLSVSGLDDLGIGLYQGGIGVKHWFSNSFVLKSILGFSGRRSTRQSPNPDYTDQKTNQGSIRLYLGTEFHFTPDSRFSPYFYTGLKFSTSATTHYYSIPKLNPPPGSTEKRRISSNSFGLDGAIGLEYFFSRRLSLAAEYQSSLIFQTDKEKRTLVPGPGITQPRELKSTSTTIGTSTSSLILTLYF